MAAHRRIVRKNVDDDHNNIMNIHAETPMTKCDIEEVKEDDDYIVGDTAREVNKERTAG